jgi:hypothetical protein
MPLLPVYVGMLTKILGSYLDQIAIDPHFSLTVRVEVSLDRKPSNEGSFFRPAGREKAGDESGGNKPAYAATKRYFYNSCSGNKNHD